MESIFVKADGGRAEAGYKGTTKDCVARAICIATGKPYKEVCDLINQFAATERPGSKRKRGKRSSAMSGVFQATTLRIMAHLGWKWTPTMGIGTGCKVHLKADELPKGRIICRVSKHLVAVIDGVIHDNGNPDRGGTRCVYGYWSAP
jgi:hypothetical protein